MRLTVIIATALIILFSYSIIGTYGNVEEIRVKAPQEMAEHNWKIIRYESWHYGSWNHHGGYVWYHVQDIDNASVQYRVKISSWDGELQYSYGAPEKLSRIDVKY